MHKYYFPPCNIEGAYEPPVKFNHLGSKNKLPNKCSQCKYLFEGGCTRSSNELNRYMQLDYGPCGIEGSTEPTQFEDEFIVSKVEVPKKCKSCVHLKYKSIYGFVCRKDHQKWGGFRGLDWGAWSPDKIYLELPYPKITSKKLIDLFYDNNLLEFIKEYRKLHPNLSMNEAKSDFKYLQEKSKELN